MITNELSGKQSIAETFSPGQVLAESLTLKQKLSTADIGILWLAHDGESGKDLELLFLPGALLSDSHAMDELRAQVKLNRQLIHPHVLRTHDFIEEEGWAAISSDAVEAETLASLLAKKGNSSFDPSDIKAWSATLCQTLDDAHRAGLLHRDLVVRNILLTKGGEILITNFGISRIILDALRRALGPGKIDEHLASMSPQQLDGELPARWDDIYALGALIYQLLTGKPPFYSGDILPQIRKTVPPPLADRRAEFGINGEQVPAGWEKVIAACLEKHTPQRPKSAREVGVKLGAEISLVTPPTQVPLRTEPKEQPVQAKPLPDTQQPKEPVQAKPLPEIQEPREPVKSKAPQEIQKPQEPAKPVPPPATVVPAVPAESQATKESQSVKESAEAKASKESLIEDIVWRKPSQHPQPAPGEPPSFKHLLEKLPERQQDKKEFPILKIAVIAAFIFAAIWAIFHLSQGKQEQVSAVPESSATPAPAAATTPAPAPTPEIANTQPPRPAVSPSIAVAPGTSVDDMRKDVQEKIKAQQQAASDAAAAKAALDAQTAALGTMKKTADDNANLRKQREDEEAKATADATKAVADAEAAQKAAADKANAAAAATKAKEQILSQIKDQEDALQKAQAQMPALQKAAADKQSAADAAGKAEKDAEARLQQGMLTQAEVQASSMQNPTATPQPSVSTPTPASSKPTPLASASPGKTPSTDAIAEAEQDVLNHIKSSNQPGTDVTQPGATPSAPSTYVTNPNSQIDQTRTNSLGMKFQPVGDVLFSIWLTRVQDFEVFARETHFKDASWLQPGFKQGPDHPVVYVTWFDAVAFCKWLTDKEHKSGLLAPNQSYRLPTDLEWSKAVGLPEETGKTPDDRDVGIKDVYPWGTQWPPPPGAGNYDGEETGSEVSIKGYNDGYIYTSPVGAFGMNKYGLYDMGGNAWEWCMDWYNGEQKQKVLRGGSWYNGDLQLSLLSSCRWPSPPDKFSDNFGFRCVIATETRSKR